MSVVVVGLEHGATPLKLLEGVTVGDAELPKFLGALRDRVNLEESVLLSTCLRTEVYAVVDRFHEAVAEVQELLAQRAGVPVADLGETLSVRFDDDVPPHLFSVAAGLQSAVVGESEVLGQVRRAADRAAEERSSGPVLAELFSHAVRAGRRVRSETAISRGTTSFSHAAVQLARARLPGGLAGRRVVVVGAGEMGRGLLGALQGASPGEAPAQIVLVNRTLERARSLVGSAAGGPGDPGDPGRQPVPVEVMRSGEARAAFALADVVLCAVKASAPVVGPGDLCPDGPRTGRPLVVVDLGVPRNVDPAVGLLPGVTLLDMDDLRASVGHAVAERQAEIAQASTIVDEEVARYHASRRARGAAPVVAALRARIEGARLAEIERRRPQFSGFSDAQWGQVDAATRAVLAKVLHEPTVLLKETAGTPRGERLVEALRILFDL